MTVHVITSPVFFLNSLYGIPIEAKMEKNHKTTRLQFGQQPHWESYTCLEEQNSAALGRLLPLQLCG